MAQSKIDKFVERMLYWCETADLGYDQSNRWNIKDYGTCDCSSLVYWSLWESGLLQKPMNLYSREYWTGTLQDDLTEAGWSILPFTYGDLQPGDILLNSQMHVAVVVYGSNHNSFVAQGSIDENGNITGGLPGDQTGRETNVRLVYDYPWDCVLRLKGNDMDIDALMNWELAVGDGTKVPFWQLASWGYLYSKQSKEKLDEIDRKLDKILKMLENNS